MIIRARVKPNSKTFSIKLDGDKFIISVASMAKGNRANVEIIRKLRRLTGRHVEILNGLKSRDKTIFIHDMNESEFRKTLFP